MTTPQQPPQQPAPQPVPRGPFPTPGPRPTHPAAPPRPSRTSPRIDAGPRRLERKPGETPDQFIARIVRGAGKPDAELAEELRRWLPPVPAHRAKAA